MVEKGRTWLLLPWRGEAGGGGGEGGVEERGGRRPRDEKVGDSSVRRVMVVVVGGATAAGEHKDTAATLSKHLFEGGRGYDDNSMQVPHFHQ